MGAYENPDVVIDTQSGQHIRNMISSLSGTAINVMKEFKAKEDAEAKRKNEFNKEIITSTNETSGKVKTGSVFNIKPMANSVKGTLMPLSVDAVSNDSKKSTAAYDKIQVTQNDFKKTAEASVSEPTTYWDTIKTAKQKAMFTEGAEYSEAPEEWKEFSQALVQNKGARADVDFMKNDNGEYDFTDSAIDYSTTTLGGKEIKRSYSLSAIRNKNEVFPNGEYTIPKMKYDDHIKSLSTIFNVKDGKVEEGLSDLILNNPKFVKDGRKPMGQYAKGDKTGKVVSAGDYITSVVDRNAVADDPAVVEVTSSVIGSMADHNPRGLAMYTNDILRRQFPDLVPKISNIDDPEELSKNLPQITKAYSRLLVYKQLPNPEIIKKDAAGNPVYVKNTTEKVEGGGGTAKPTQAELKAAATRRYIQERYAKVRNNNKKTYKLSKDGSIALKEGKLIRYVPSKEGINMPADEIPLTEGELEEYGFK